MRAPLSRRRLLLGGSASAVVAVGAAGVAAEDGILPGGVWLRAHLGQNGPIGVVPEARPGPFLSRTFVSARRGGARTGWSLSYPPGASVGDRLPVLVFLHGLGGDHRMAFGGGLGLNRFQAVEAARSGRRFAIASVDGGSGYWHRRPDGSDAGAMVLDELFPRLADHGLAVRRPGLMGLSMGGYGALRLGGLLGASRCAVVVAESPALWTDPAAASPQGFSGPAEYDAFTVLGHQRDLTGLPLRIDCGTGDPFHDATLAYVAGFSSTQRPVVGFQPGAHNLGYWRRMAPAQLAFAARHLH